MLPSLRSASLSGKAVRHRGFLLSSTSQQPDHLPAIADGEPVEQRLFSANFIFATLANFFNSFGTQMMNATIPVYVLSLGGNNAEAGIVGGALAMAALLVRPLVGWLTDVWKRRPLAIIGSASYGLASVAYAFSTSIGTLLLGRVVHGFGISCYSTAANAYVVDIAPTKRRTEAIGLFASTNSLGLIIGPAVGFYIISLSGFRHLFHFATALAFTACIVSVFAKEKRRRQNGTRAAWSLRTGIVSTAALPMAWTSLCLGLAMGAVNTFIAIFASSIGIGNPGLYFTVQAIALLIARAFLGRVADRRGCAAAIIPGIVAMSAALAILPLARSLAAFLACAAFFGLGVGIAQPATMSLLANQVCSEQHGLGLATYFMGYDGGHFLGSIAFGVVSQLWGFGVMWPLSAVCTLLGLWGLLAARPGRMAASR